ncbi:MAG: serine hydrolase [Ilumatobacteraceae bacterium]
MSDFPVQPPAVAWPTLAWPQRPLDDRDVEALVGQLFSDEGTFGLSLALVVVRGGEIVTERYGPECGPDTTLISWSMAKSITHAVFGLLVGDGLVDLDAPAPVAAWADDDRSAITIRDLLEMSSGLHFVEDYVDGEASDVIEMLFGSGQGDHAAYAADQPAEHPPGTVWSYSSGTTNILARIATDLLGGAADPDGGRGRMERFLADRLFGPLGMSSASPKFDDRGTFVGSSYVYATARDFARFGLLYLRGGRWQDSALLPDGWVESARTPARATVPTSERHGYGSHWWTWFRSRSAFSANGYETQRIVVDPERDLVIVRLGKTPAELGERVDEQLDRLRTAFSVVPPS